MNIYHRASICLKGHIISNEEKIENEYCEKCGSEIINYCPNCQKEIRGKKYEADDNPRKFPYHLPKYCYNCGKPYPWTLSRIKSIEACILEDESISSNEKEELTTLIPDIITETPNTNSASIKFKKVLSKIGGVTKEMLTKIIIEVACEAAKTYLNT